MKSALALRYATFGPPEEVLHLEEVPLPPIEPDKALVNMLAAPINPSDLGMITGRYGHLKPLPTTAGREGVGKVSAIGSAVTNIRVGERVLLSESEGTWQTAYVTPAEKLQSIPGDVAVTDAAMSQINPPTAWLLLHDASVQLRRGDWILQNAANAAVGLCVIRLARKLGLHTFNVVRRAELVAPLKAMGADVVVTEEDDYITQAQKLPDDARIQLALNSVGGRSAANQLKILTEGGIQVTFGAMSFEPVRFPTRFLIFKDIRLNGFWLERWLRDHSRQEIANIFDQVYEAIREGTFRIPVEKAYRLQDYRAALAHNARPRLGKVIFTGDEPSL